MMEIEGRKAVVAYDPEIGMFRGEFLGLFGGADFYGESIEALKREGKVSLEVYLDMPREKYRAVRCSARDRWADAVRPLMWSSIKLQRRHCEERSDEAIHGAHVRW